MGKLLDREIIQDNIQIIQNYHEETKHHYHKYANALGHMDWDTQPDSISSIYWRRFDPLVASTPRSYSCL